MGVDATGEGADAWVAAVERLRARLHEATDHAVDDGLALIQRGAQKNLTKYTHPRRTPTPSTPGEPPALISGALRRSVVARRALHGPQVYSGGVGPTIVYGPIQERGGATGRGHRTILPARPYLAPAARDAAAAIRKLFADAWSAAIKG